jgi:hypothetical protein
MIEDLNEREEELRREKPKNDGAQDERIASFPRNNIAKLKIIRCSLTSWTNSCENCGVMGVTEEYAAN